MSSDAGVRGSASDDGEPATTCEPVDARTSAAAGPSVSAGANRPDAASVVTLFVANGEAPSAPDRAASPSRVVRGELLPATAASAAREP